MIQEFSGIYFGDFGWADGFYRNLPGYPGFICLDVKHQGNEDKILDIIVTLLEVGKTLTPRQKCHKQLFRLVDGVIYRYEDDAIGSYPVDHFYCKKEAPALASFSRN